ncbi:phosphoenolpyruvate--protein phosphotransferase [Lachnospiraceae bacterium C1.1]|nr:phosphoenolpyruvate--protein phosphotransferase [Lachnospiraceae bacterium C1.1]
MERYTGKKIYEGIAIGKIAYLGKKEQVVERKHTEDSEGEKRRYESAREEAISQLRALYEKTKTEIGEADAEIFDVHAMMLEDDGYNDSVYNIIEAQKMNAEYAVAVTGDNFAETFASMDDEYFKARSVDVKDISERVIRILTGEGEASVDATVPSILVADDLTPSETVQLDKSKILAFVTRKGSSNSHTAILARTMNIPAIINIDVNESWNGKMGILDSDKNIFIVDPDETTMKMYEALLDEQNQKKQLLQDLKGKPTETKSGKSIMLYANVGNLSDIASALQYDAGGIGLFRSEFIYLGKETYPTEEEQFAIYRKAAELMAGKKVIIRTLDIGADKQCDYFELGHEENPAMGFRAIRICLKRPEVFKTQLRALFRAAAYGNIYIMYPMITSMSEISQIKKIVAEVKAELEEQGVPYKDAPQGVMIETPAAAVITDLLAKEVDFFSIGTNDLTQYTLAIDRQNAALDDFCDTHHEAVLRLIKMTVDNAHAAGIWAGICGELAADTSLTKTFLEMGVDELSVAPPSVLKVRKIVRDCD